MARKTINQTLPKEPASVFLHSRVSFRTDVLLRRLVVARNRRLRHLLETIVEEEAIRMGCAHAVTPEELTELAA